MHVLQPLTPVKFSQNVICCCACTDKQMYNAACQLGWRCDPLGVPYYAFFCPSCARRFEELQQQLGEHAA